MSSKRRGTRRLATQIGVIQAASALEMRDATVTAVADDGTVNIVLGGGLLLGVPCLSSYLNRTVGDVVQVLQVDKRLVVQCKIGDEVDLTDALSIPPETVVQWGTSAPGGSGWVHATDVYVKRNQVFAVYSTGSPDPTPTASTHTTLSASDQGSWRDGRRNHDEDDVIQGAWPTYPHPYSGLWLYGTSIASACSGHTVSSMQFTITRRRGSGGVFGGASMHLYLHGYTTAPSGMPSLYSQWNPGTLEPGEVKHLSLPASWVSALASGSARGIGCKASVGSSYLTYSSGGTLKMNFSS